MRTLFFARRERMQCAGYDAGMPGINEEALGWLRGLILRDGLLRGIWNAIRSLVEVLLDCLPARRRLRYGDIDFDWDHGVDTTWANPSMAVRLREVFTSGKYQPSDPSLFHEILRQLPVRYDEFSFVDLGSGKGRTLLMASDYPFRAIVGIEIIADLHAVALENLQRYRGNRQRCFSLTALCGDARQFVFPGEPLVLYLFNPFPSAVLRQVLRNLDHSFREHPRPICVVYHNLVHEDVFLEMSFLRKVAGTHQFAIFVADAA